MHYGFDSHDRGARVAHGRAFKPQVQPTFSAICWPHIHCFLTASQFLVFAPAYTSVKISLVFTRASVRSLIESLLMKTLIFKEYFLK